MITLTRIDDLRRHLQPFRDRSASVALVPTMGFLHEGHLSLIRAAKKNSGIVVTSIFVNPTQFAPTEDLEKYPRDIARDTELAAAAGCDVLFVPSVEEMYPAGFSTFVTVEGLSSVLEGKFRPVHFKGVTTVVLKLFNIVQPHTAWFGQKDAQQCIVVKKMVRDLDIPVRIEIVPTVREKDGLALSSRNVYLSPEQRSNAAVLSASLVWAQQTIERGEKDVKAIVAGMTAMIRQKNSSQIDYIAVVDSETLEEKQQLRTGETVLIPLAVRFGSTRLIDNIIITVN